MSNNKKYDIHNDFALHGDFPIDLSNDSYWVPAKYVGDIYHNPLCTLNGYGVDVYVSLRITWITIQKIVARYVTLYLFPRNRYCVDHDRVAEKLVHCDLLLG